MVIKVLGIKHASGEFNDDNGQLIKYDNYLLYFESKNNELMFGQCYDFIKLKSRVLLPFIEKVGYKDVKLLIGKQVNLDYDQTGRLVDVAIIR